MSVVTTHPTPVALGLARGLLAVLNAATSVIGALAWLLEGASNVIGRVYKTLPIVVATGVVTTLSTASCGPLDMGCKIDEWQTGWLQGLNATFGVLTQSMIEGVFTSSASTINSAGWNVGLTSVNRLAAVMAIVVVGLCAIQIILTLIAKQKAGIIRAVAGAVLAWPVCALSVTVAIQLVKFGDQLAESIIANSTAIATMSTLVDMAWVTSMATGNPVGIAMASLFFLFVIFIPTVLLTVVMAFRNYALVVAIAVAPVSLMTWGLKSLQGMVRGWGKITAALVLTKPVMALSIMIAGEMVGAGLTGGGIGPFMTGVVGLFTAAAAPATAMAMVTGAMAIADSGISRSMEEKGAQTVSRAGHGAVNAGKKGAGKLGLTGPESPAGKFQADTADKVRAKTSSFFSRGGSASTEGSSASSSSTTSPAPVPSPVSPGGSATPSPSAASKPSGEAPQGAGSGRKAGEKAGGAAGKAGGEAAGGAAGGAVGSAVPVVGTAIGKQVGSQVGGQIGQNVGQSVGGAAGGAVDTAASSASPAAGGSDGPASNGPTSKPIFAPEGAPTPAGEKPPAPAPAQPKSGGSGNSSSGGGKPTPDAGGTTRGGADLSGGLK